MGSARGKILRRVVIGGIPQEMQARLASWPCDPCSACGLRGGAHVWLYGSTATILRFLISEQGRALDRPGQQTYMYTCVFMCTYRQPSIVADSMPANSGAHGWKIFEENDAFVLNIYTLFVVIIPYE